VTGCGTLKLISEYGPAISTSASLSFGPFSVGGSYSHSSSKETFKSTFDGVTLKIPGLQILAWISEICPHLHHKMHPLDHSQHYLKVVKGSYTERDYCGSKDPTNKKMLDFINALLNDVKDVANDLDVPIRIYSYYQLLKKNLSFSLMHRFCMKISTYAKR
jgi:hypothetical protein